MNIYIKENKQKLFKEDLERNNQELTNKFKNFYIDLALNFASIRESYRVELYDIENIEDNIIEKDYKSLYLCSDYLNETIRDIKIINKKLYFTADFYPYQYDGMLTAQFYLDLNKEDFDFYYEDEDYIYFKIEDINADLDEDTKIIIKQGE